MKVLRVERHAVEVLTQLSILWESGELCDVTLIANDGETRLPCHRSLLATCSDYFRAMFTKGSGSENPSDTQVTLEKVDGATLKTVIKFCYTNQIVVDETNIAVIYEAASCLQLRMLIAKLEENFRNIINFSNCHDFLVLNDKLRSNKLQLTIEDFIEQNLQELAESPKFTEWSPNRLQGTLFNPKNGLSFEESFTFLAKWAMPNKNHNISPSLVNKTTQCDSTISVEGEGLISLPSPLPSSTPSQTLIAVMRSYQQPTAIHVMRYNCVNRKWMRLACFPDVRINFAVCKLQDVLYFAGGYLNGSSSNEVHTLDLRNNTWSQSAPLALPRHGLQLIAGADELFAVGGISDERTLSNIDRYDLVTNQWYPMTKLPTPKAYVGVTIDEEILLCAGGWKGKGAQNSVDVYNRDEKTWHSLEDMMYTRHDYGILAHDGHVYCAGGDTPWIERFSLDNRHREATNVPESNSVTAMVCYDAKLLAFGNGVVLERDAERGEWTRSATVKPLQGKIYTVCVMPTELLCPLKSDDK